ncbi:MAG: hypothetical protein Q9159_003594 [Coniocarpon cinnabarinum]
MLDTADGETEEALVACLTQTKPPSRANSSAGELRDLNARAWAGEHNVFGVSESLDSSMKKNTAFIRRLRTPISANSTNTILQEIRSLSLHKYLSEIISACYEGLVKLRAPADIAAGVEIFSALHQRFGPHEFTSYVAWLIGRGLTPPDKAQLKLLPQDVREKEERDRFSRNKILLRVATELWLVGALRGLDDVAPPQDAVKQKDPKTVVAPGQKRESPTKAALGDTEPFPLEVLKELLGQDGQHQQVAMVASYSRIFALDLLGKCDAEGEVPAEMDAPLVDEHTRQRFRNVLVKYFEGGKLHLMRDQDHINCQSRRNTEAYVRSGEIFEDRQATYEKMVKSQERLLASLQTLASCLDAEMPDLREKDTTALAADSSIGLVKTEDYLRGATDGAGIWDDEEERRFYENLIDVKDRVPGILFEDGKRKRDFEEQPSGALEDTRVANANEAPGSEDVKEPSHQDVSATANKSVGAQVDSLLARLPEATNKDTIDDLAISFCFVNSKASRNRLLKAVQEVPKGRSDLLPLYSRLITTLGRQISDLTQSLVVHLDEEFRSLQRRKQKDSLSGVRTSNIRYLAELTKFGVVPEHIIFHCLKVSLDDFSRMNIEVICHLLENCGKFLLRNPETQPRMRSFLETLNRKKSASHLGQQERMLIENAMYSVDPPERAAIQQKERTPVELFIRRLLYDELNKRNVEKVIKQIRKLHWEDEEVVAILRKAFVKPWRIKWHNLHYLAIILGSLHRYHQDFTIGVIDDVLESIHLNLEINDFKANQKRIAEVRYVAELYVYRMVDSSVIFDLMYKLVTFGHGGWPKPASAPAIDLPDDFFRVRLVCTLMDICGSFFDKGVIRKKFDFFLAFFQYYIFTKDTMPMDVEYVVHDTFTNVRSDWRMVKTLHEAGSTFAQVCKDNGNGTSSTQTVDAEELDGDDGDMEGEVKARRTSSKHNRGDSSDGGEAELDPEEEEREPENSDLDTDTDDEDNIIVTRHEQERDPEADAEFDRELAKMMAESVNETRKPDRKPALDIALPMRRVQQRDGIVNENDDPETLGPTVQFSLLSRRGNRPQTRAIDLPADSTFALAHRTQLEAEKAEQQRIKALVLNYDLGQDQHSHPDNVNGDYPPFHSPSNQHLAPLQPNVNHTTNRLRRVSANHPQLAKEKPDPIERPLVQQPVSVREQGSRRDSEQQQRGAGNASKRQQARKLQMSDVDWYSSLVPPPSSPL